MSTKNAAPLVEGGTTNIAYGSIIAHFNGQVNDQTKYIKHIFGPGTEGYVYYAHISGEKIRGKYVQWPNILEEVANYADSDDIYITPNTFYVPQRRAANIRHFRALYVDLDLEKYGKAETVYLVYTLADLGRIPVPTLVVDSGRGIHLYWRIYDAPVQVQYTWRKIERHLFDQLRDLGADPAATDPARLLRLPGTRNSRNGATCNILVMNDTRYNLGELAAEYVRVPKPKKRAKANEKAKVYHVRNLYNLNLSRAKDIETLVQFRGGDVTGLRNTILHMYAGFVFASCKAEDETYTKVNELNQSFTEPLRTAEVNTVVRCIVSGNKQYNYRNERIIELLNITEEEQNSLKTIISAQEKQRRNTVSHRQKRRKNEEKKEDRDIYTLALEMQKNGATQAKIAKELGLSQGRVSQILR